MLKEAKNLGQKHQKGDNNVDKKQQICPKKLSKNPIFIIGVP